MQWIFLQDWKKNHLKSLYLVKQAFLLLQVSLHNNHRYHRRNHFYIASICFCLWNEIVIIIFIVVILIITRICNIWRFFIIILKNDRTKIAATAINAILISRQNSLSFSFGYFLLNPFFKLSQIINSKYNFIYFRENILFFWKKITKVILKNGNYLGEQ